MTTSSSAEREPSASASHEERRRFLTLAALFLSGPVIWISYFMAVYLLGEVVCVAEVDRRLLGLPLLSSLTLMATFVALGVTAITTRWAHRRWQASGVGWRASKAEVLGVNEGGEQEGHLALAGWLLGVLFAVAILFVGLPAAVLAC